MQAHSSTYDIIIAQGGYSIENRIDMYDRPTKNGASQLSAVLSSSRPPSGGVLITKRKWESNSKYGGRNGTFQFTYASGAWYYNYGHTGQELVRGSIESLGIAPASRGSWIWTNGDRITVTRYEPARTKIHTFYGDEIVSINPTWSVFVQDSPTIGGCYAGQNRIQLRTENVNIPTMAEFRVFKRIYNQSRTSEWLEHGTFYVDTRDPDSDLGTTAFVCYDSMLMTEQVYRELSGISEWPAEDTRVIQEICGLIGIGFDTRDWDTRFATKVDYPNDKTMREVLGEIATAHCGNFVISYANQLRFVPFKGSSATVTSLDSKWEEFELQEPFKPYRQVNLWYDDEHAFSYPYPILDGKVWDDSPIGKTNGDFAFQYTTAGGSGKWMYDGKEMRLGDCGLSYIGQPMEGDIIRITREQDISIKATRDGRTDELPVNLSAWDMSDLGGHNGTYTFQYIDDPESSGIPGWYYGDEYISLGSYGIAFSGNSENGDSIRVVRFEGERPRATVSSDNPELSVSIDVDTWEDSNYGGVNGTFQFEYSNFVKITQQQTGMTIPIELSSGNRRSWESYMGTVDGSYVLTYGGRKWILTSGPSGTPGTEYRLSDIGLSFSGIPQDGNTITVVRDGTLTAWKDGNIIVNPTALGIAIQSGQSSLIWSGSGLEFQNGRSASALTAGSAIYASGANWSAKLHAGETITISGCTHHTENNKSVTVKQISGDYLYFNENTFKLDTLLRYDIPVGGLSAANYHFYTGTATRSFTLGSDASVGSYFMWDGSNLMLETPSGGTRLPTAAVSLGSELVFRNSEMKPYAESGNVSIVKAPAAQIGDHLTVVRNMEYIDEITGTVVTPNIDLEIDPETWEASNFGKKDGATKFRYNATNHSWTYYTGSVLVPIVLSDYGIVYDLIPDHYDVITITRESGLAEINAQAIVSDRILEGECSWATQELVNRIYNEVSGYIYRPYTGTGVFLDPALEPGDKIKRNGSDILQFLLATLDADEDLLYTADISAPADAEVDHEYEYKSQTQKDLSRKVTLGKPYYGTSISREKGIFIERSDGQSEALFNSDVFSMRARINDTMQDRIYFDPIAGDYVFSGALAADAVFTGSLYAEQGMIAELTVDRLTTSRRIREYLLDQHYRPEPIYADDNYIEIQDYHIKWITGSVARDDNDEAIVVQAVDRNGSLLFWDGMVHDCTADGYPLGEDGNQLYSTETDTGFPVQVYQYNELSKMQGLFEHDGTNYVPKLIFGVGDENANNVCHMYKATDGLHIDYRNSSGETDSIAHYESENFWRLNGIGIAPVDELPEEPLHDVIYLTPEE